MSGTGRGRVSKVVGPDLPVPVAFDTLGSEPNHAAPKGVMPWLMAVCYTSFAGTCATSLLFAIGSLFIRYIVHRHFVTYPIRSHATMIFAFVAISE